MTYFAEIDPEYKAKVEADAWTFESWADEFMPEWRELSIDPESRVYVSESDVLDAEDYVSVKVGERHYVLSPAASDRDMPYTEIKF